VREEPGVTARVYSGRSGSVEACTVNAVPVTMVDIRLAPGATFQQDLPSTYNAFVLVLEGSLQAGEPATRIHAGQVGWTHPADGEGGSTLTLTAAAAGARALLYAGEPQRVPIAARGPFVAGSESELAAYYAAFRRGEFPRASTMRKKRT